MLAQGKRFNVYALQGGVGKAVRPETERFYHLAHLERGMIRKFEFETIDSCKYGSVPAYYRREDQICAVETSMSGELTEGSTGSPVVGKTRNRTEVYGFVTAKIYRNYVSFTAMVPNVEFLHAAARHSTSMPDGRIRKLRRAGTSFELVT
ncbi:unnamed protein product [Soboliphyme baturini]|uniref:Peptidase S1 domain-containing protein n=1 Tax=Soboliphyme baturini TaxID=241478 RepID=A0A183IPB2_9BILA|nr:unnamed protein product [Soboliphyme baturini]